MGEGRGKRSEVGDLSLIGQNFRIRGLGFFIIAPSKDF
jgi:hypothetical protein